MKSALLDAVSSQFALPVSRMRALQHVVVAEMDAGLAGHSSTMAMLPAFCDIANGGEQGLFLALDLGGTNFRVMMIHLKGHGASPVVLAEAKYKLTQAQISSTGEVLFDSIAGSLRRFLKEHGFSGCYRLGYTFSFPVKLVRLDEGILVKWTKDFSATGVVGRKIVQLQRKALARKRVSTVTIGALANDTVGTLQAQAILDPDCAMGVILGTGFNMAIRIASRRVKTSGSPSRGKGLIINTESGGFSKGLPLTRYDRQVDRDSGNRGHQLVEKMIAGKYLPQLARALILEFIKKEGLFDGVIPPVFEGKASFKGPYMDVFEAGDREAVNRLSVDLFGRILTMKERYILSGVCRLVSGRSARLAAVMIVSALKRAKLRSGTRVTVAVDGSLFEKYPGYSRRLAGAIRDMTGNRLRVSLKLTKDGSGIGAAVIAAVVSEATKSRVCNRL